MPKTAEQIEHVRDLRTQISEIAAEDVGDVLFVEISPGRNKVTLYSMQTGEPVEFPQYMVRGVLEKRLVNGKYAFTSQQDKAPTFRPGQVKCFLHSESPERPIVEELGLGAIDCPAASLRSAQSKRIHALHRHRQEWAAYQEYMTEQKQRIADQRQEQQLEATLSIARGSRSNASEATLSSRAPRTCETCGKGAKSNAGLQAHIRARHPA